MFLKKAYGRSVMTGGLALLMVLSMIINESLVARTFGAYVMQAVDRATDPMWVPLLAVLLIAVVFAVNVATNAVISRVAVLSGVIVLFVQIGALSPETQHPCGFQADATASADRRH